MLYKELHVFERDIADLRIKVQSIMSQIPLNVEVVNDTKGQEVDAYTVTQGHANVIDNNKEHDDESDSASVTSNEIKDILTNIQEHVEDEMEEDFDYIQVTNDEKQTETEARPKAVQRKPRENSKAREAVQGINIHELSDDEVRKISYDNLRSLLRVYGVTNPKGTKEDLVTSALNLKNSSTGKSLTL